MNVELRNVECRNGGGENPEFRRQRDEGIEGQNVELGLDYVV